jgi:thiamine-phosphate pyrophosphorylase
MVFKLLRRHKAERVAGLYLIIDVQTLGGRSEVEAARQAVQGGTRIIQLRDKIRPKRELVPLAQELRKVCTQYDVLFIVNDHLDVALASDADGLHLGQDDLPLSIARRLLPVDKIVGCSTATLDEALQAQKQGADYIAVGSIYPTPSKPGTRLAGIETLLHVKKQVSIPVVAVGGINEDNVAEVMSASADAVAVISAVLKANDVKEASRRLTAIIGGKE